MECKDEEEKQTNKEIYKTTETDVKLVATVAKTAAFKGLYVELRDKGRDKKLYKFTKVKREKARDLDQVKCIKNEEDKVLIEETIIKQRWLAFFHKLLNEVEDKDIVLEDLEHSHRHRDFGYCTCIKVEEVKSTISKMSKGRATRPNEIPM